jgi:aminoglycoside phosphotransferase (APT) family kinase protein
LAIERDLDQLRPRIERWLGRAVHRLERPAPGWSCETLIVDDDVVIRLPPLGEGAFPDYDLGLQAAVQERVSAAGVPIAADLRYEPDPDVLGAPFLTMGFARGVIPSDFTAGDEWLRDLPDDRARRAVWETFVDTVLAIGTADLTGLGLRTGLAAELAWWDRYVGWATDGAPPSDLTDALAWCAANQPATEPPPTLLWGDVRFGNVVFDPDRRLPVAVLDWDMTSAGPLEMDLAWFLALEGLQADLSGMTVGGFGTTEDLVARAGRPLHDLDWHVTFALVRAAAVATRLAVLFERAGQRSMFRIGQDPTLAAAVARIDAR